jgi:hypothetical protein
MNGRTKKKMTNTPRAFAAMIMVIIENDQKQRDLARETQEAEEAIARAREIERKIERMNEY